MFTNIESHDLAAVALLIASPFVVAAVSLLVALVARCSR